MAVENDEHDTPVFPGGIPLQVARWTEQRASVATGPSSARVTIPAGAEIVELTASESCYINFGGSGVDASSVIASDGSRLFLAGVQAIVVPLDGSGVPFTHVAAIRQSTSGIFQVEQLG